MQKTNTKKMGTVAALAIVIMSFGAFVALASIVTKNQSHITPVSLANDGEDSEDSSSKDEDKSSEKAKEADKKKEENNRESVKKQAERQQEDTKKQLERSNKDSEDNDSNDDSNKIGDDNKDTEDTKDVNGEDNGMFKDKNKTLADLNEKLAEAEKNILEKQAEGTDVTTALANLALAKSKLAGVNASFNANDLEAAKELAKEIKKTAHFTEKDMEFAKESNEAVGEVSHKIGEVNKKIASLEALGGDASAYKAQLASLQADFATLQSSGVTSRETVKAFEKKAGRLKSLVERAIFALGGTEDDDLYADHEKDSQDLEDDLNDVAEIESGDDNGVAKEVKAVVLAHKLAAQDIKKNLEDIQNRGGLEKILLGADVNALDGLTAQATAMNTRADALITASDKITDPQIKQILVDRAAALRSEVAKLQAYISSEGSQFSIFGKLLSFFR